MLKRTFRFAALLTLALGLFLSVPQHTFAYVQRDIAFSSITPHINSVDFAGTVTIHSIINPPGQHAPIHLRVKWGVTGGQYTYVVSNDIVSQSSVALNTPVPFTVTIGSLTPNTSYDFAFFDTSDSADLIATPPAVQTLSDIPEIEIRKPSGAYGSTPEVDYTQSSTSIVLAGMLRSSLSTQVNLEVHYTKSGGQPQTVSGPGVFSQMVTYGQEYPFNVTLSGLDPSSTYQVEVYLSGQSTALWSESIDTDQASVSDHIIIGGPYGTQLLSLDPNCNAQPLIGLNGQPIPPPAITGRCIDVTTDNAITVAMDASGTDRQASGTASVKIYKGDSYSVGLVWGDSPSSMNKLWENPVFFRIMNAGDTDTFPFVMHSLLPNHTYYYTFVNFDDPAKAYMSPKTFTATLTPAGSTTGGASSTSGGTNSGVGPSAPLVAPGNLVPCDGSRWQPCTFAYLIQLVNNVIKWLIVIAIPIMAIGFVYIGFLFIAKGGSEEARSRAKHVIINMLIGLICILCAWLIVNLILDTLLKADSAASYKLLQQ